MGVGGQRYAPAASLPGMTRYPLHRRLCGPQGRSGRVREISLYQLSYPDPCELRGKLYFYLVPEIEAKRACFLVVLASNW